MSNIKNKDTLYLVVRYNAKDGGEEVVCAITRTQERAEELCAEYEQQLIDKGILLYSFYVQGQTYYDE